MNAITCAACKRQITGAWKRDDDGRVVHAVAAECASSPRGASCLLVSVSLLIDRSNVPRDFDLITAMTRGLIAHGYIPDELLITGHELLAPPSEVPE